MVEFQFFALQMLGVFFGLIMLYLTFLYYRKNTYEHLSLTIWSFAWTLFILIVLFPPFISSVLSTFKIARLLDFFVIAGFFFFSAMVFYLFIVARRVEKRMEKLVDQVAKKLPERPRKKK